MFNKKASFKFYSEYFVENSHFVGYVFRQSIERNKHFQIQLSSAFL